MLSDTKELLDWPDDSSDWWWMRFKTSKAARKWNTLLVMAVKRSDGEWVDPYGDSKMYSKGICQDQWQAKFLPAATPPCDKDWELTKE